jgi:hypothetical protein
MELRTNSNKGIKFVTVLSDGKFHQSVEEGTPGSVIREYEDSKGVKGSKVELVFSEASGKITNIKFEDGEYGKNIQIEMDGNGVISLGTSSSFGEDFMKKFPNIDLSDVVLLKPYSFEDDKGKNRKGITIYQNGAKVENYYYDPVSNKPCNGIPEVEGDTKKFSKDDWKMHFMVVRKFLIGEVEKIVLNSEDALGARVVPTSPSKPKNFEEDDIPIVEDGEEFDVKDLPF